jgi:hypothetical protein
MKTSRSRIFAVILLFVLALASSIPARQTAHGSSQIAGWVNQVHLPLVMYDSPSLPTSTPTSTSTPTPTPTLTLTVTQSPLAIWPPIMIYTAQLNYVPPTTTAHLKVDFYNLAGARVEYLGSAPVNQTGQAQLSRQVKPGTYTAIARVMINSQVIWSNIVTYEVL